MRDTSPGHQITSSAMSRAGPAPLDVLTAALGAALHGLPRRLAVVMFHVNQDPGHPFESLQAGCKHDYGPVIAKSVAAARAVHPEALVVMLTDEQTQFAPDLPVELIRLPLVREWIMYERTRCQQAFASVWPCNAIHIDTDVVLQKRFDDLFGMGFDVGLSYRDYPGMHINGGMLLCGNAAGFARFMQDFTRMYDAIADAAEPWNGFDLRCFRGGQLALAALMYDRQPGVHKMTWGRVAVFNAREVNRTYGEPGETRPYAYHFKGHRKSVLGSVA